MATTITLLKTDESWNGDKLPDYFIGKPEAIINKVLIPPKTNLPWHHHDLMSFAYVLKGEFYIVSKDGKEKHFKEGDALSETVGTIHRGENRSLKDCEIIVFYPSKAGFPLSVPHPECEEGKTKMDNA